MNNTEQTYFQVLRNYFWAESAPIDAGTEVEALIQLAARQGTLPILADYALKPEFGVELSAAQRMMMRQAAMQQMLHQQKLRMYLRMVKECLDKADIPFVVLKGEGLAPLYPNPDVRSMSDVDIWVGQERFHDACHVLRTLPDVLTEDKQEEEGTRHFNLHWENAQYVIEVHPVTHAFPSRRENKRYQAWERDSIYEAQSTISIEGCTYHVPNSRFNMLYIFLHAWHHYLSEGMQMKQIIDWVLVLHQYALQLGKSSADPQLEQDLQFYHLIEPWQVFGWIAVHELGLPIEEMPLYSEKPDVIQKAHRLLEYILHSDQRNYLCSKQRGSGLIHKFITLHFMHLDYKTTKQIFPSYARHHLWSTVATSVRKMGM